MYSTTAAALPIEPVLLDPRKGRLANNAIEMTQAVIPEVTKAAGGSDDRRVKPP